MKLFKKIRDFCLEEDGNVAVITAILAIPLLMAAGVAVDYSRLANAQKKAQQAADAAVLAASSADDLTDAQANQEARRFFLINYPDIDQLQSYDLSISTDGSDEVEIQFTGTLPPSLTSIGNLGNMQFSVNAEAVGSQGYLDVYMMLDRSASTLIADTPQDVQNLQTYTRSLMQAESPELLPAEPDGCAFACHVIPDDSHLHKWAPDDMTLVEYAKQNNIGLRSTRIINSAENMALSLLDGARGKIRISILDFAENAIQNLEPSNDKALVKSKISENAPFISESETDYTEAFNAIETLVGTQGDGTRRNRAKKLIVLVTDGYWTRFNVPEHLYYRPFSSDSCDQLKQNGFNLAVVNTIYDEIPNSMTYATNALPNRDAATQALRDCASSEELYFEANSPAEITTAFAQLTTTIKDSVPRLSR